MKDEVDQPNYEIDVLAGHENDVNYVQFRYSVLFDKLMSHAGTRFISRLINALYFSGCAVASRFSLAETLKEDNASKFKNSWYHPFSLLELSS